MRAAEGVPKALAGLEADSPARAAAPVARAAAPVARAAAPVARSLRAAFARSLVCFSN
jgi:hypothetical protein